MATRAISWILEEGLDVQHGKGLDALSPFMPNFGRTIEANLPAESHNSPRKSTDPVPDRQMDASPSPKDIVDALRQSGYLMEQQVATQLETLGLHVWTNWAFEDVDEGKSREIDVRATRRVVYNEQSRTAAFVEIICECKNNSNPLVFIGRPKSEVDRLHAPAELLLPGRSNETFFRFNFDETHYSSVSQMKAVQFCRIERKGKNWKANHGGLYDSIFYPIAKAVTAQKLNVLKADDYRNGRLVWLFVPMVVTSGDIFFVDSTADEPVPVARDYVNFRRDIQSETLKGAFAIDFIRQDALEKFFDECLQPLLDKITDLMPDD